MSVRDLSAKNALFHVKPEFVPIGKKCKKDVLSPMLGHFLTKPD